MNEGNDTASKRVVLYFFSSLTNIISISCPTILHGVHILISTSKEYILSMFLIFINIEKEI